VTADRWVGALLGQCLGDALGFPVEGYPASECAGYVDKLLRAGQAGAIGRGAFPFGQYTDDSQLLREMLVSAVERGGFDPADYARRIAALFGERRVVGRGRATEQAAARLLAGVPWDAAGTPPPQAGNGSAMRAAGAGMLCPSGGAALVALARDQGRITHRDPRCAAGSIAIAAAVARGLRGEPADATALCAELAALVRHDDPALAEHLGALPAWARLEPAAAYAAIGPLGAAPEVGRTWPGISPFVTTSVLWSLYSFLHTPGDYWERVCTAIAVGGGQTATRPG
jgi:ADP-ribosylglycohydrolase